MINQLLRVGTVLAILTLTGCGGFVSAVSGTQSSFICPFQGTELTIQVKPPANSSSVSPSVMEEVRKVVSKRIEGIGISNAAVVPVSQNQLIVQLPKISNVTQAQRVFLSTTQLEFRQQKPQTETQLLAFQASRRELKAKQAQLEKTGNQAAIAKNQAILRNNSKAIAQLFDSTKPPLTGQYIKDAYAEPRQDSNWSIAISFDKKGSELFTNITKNLAGTGRSIGIFIDNELISYPIVGVEFATTGITGGAAVIEGRFNAEEAHDLAVQLRSGALPAPVNTVSALVVSNNRCQSK